MVLRVLLFIFCVFEVTKISCGHPAEIKIDGNANIIENLNTTESNLSNRTEIDSDDNSLEGSRNDTQLSHWDKLKTIFNYNVINESFNEFIPPSCDGQEFCEEVPYYPTKMIETALKLKNNLNFLDTRDKPLDPQVKFGSDGQDGLCKGMTKYIVPLVARNKDGESKYIINTKKYVQSLSVEVCEDPNGPCRLIDGFASGYETMCIQKYTYRKLAAISRSGEAYADWFAMPASCCCKVQLISFSKH